MIVFSSIGKGLLRVQEAGGTPTLIATLKLERNEGALMPVFLQDGKRFLFLRVSFGDVERNGIFAGTLNGTAVPEGRILATPTSVAYVPDGPDRGLLLFLRNQDLMAQSLDETRLARLASPASSPRVSIPIETAPPCQHPRRECLPTQTRRRSTSSGPIDRDG